MPEDALFRIKRWWLPSNTPSDVSWLSSSDLKKTVSTLVINSSDLQLHNVYRNIMYQMLYLNMSLGEAISLPRTNRYQYRLDTTVGLSAECEYCL